MVCLALISLFSFAFFLALGIYGFDLPGFICRCRVFNNEYRTIWGLNRPCHGFRRHLDEQANE